MNFYIMNNNNEILDVLSTDSVGSHAYILNATVDEKINSYDELTLEYQLNSNEDKKDPNTDSMHTIVFNDVFGWREYTVKDIKDTNDGVFLRREIVAELSSVELMDENVENEVSRLSNRVDGLIGLALSHTRWEIGEIDKSIERKDFYIETLNRNVLEVINDICNVFDCEISYSYRFEGNKITKRLVNIYSTIGKDVGKRFEFNKDVKSVERLVDKSEIKTAINPIGNEDEDGNVITIENIEWSSSTGDPLDKPLGQKWIGDENALQLYGNLTTSGSKKHRIKTIDYDADNAQDLITMAYKDLIDLSVPKATYEIEASDLYSITGDADYMSERAEIGDFVIVKDNDLDITLKKRLVEATRDLLNPINNKFTIGDLNKHYIDNKKESEKEAREEKEKREERERIQEYIKRLQDIENKVLPKETNYAEKVKPIKYMKNLASIVETIRQNQTNLYVDSSLVMTFTRRTNFMDFNFRFFHETFVWKDPSEPERYSISLKLRGFSIEEYNDGSYNQIEWEDFKRENIHSENFKDGINYVSIENQIDHNEITQIKELIIKPYGSEFEYTYNLSESDYEILNKAYNVEENNNLMNNPYWSKGEPFKKMKIETEVVDNAGNIITGGSYNGRMLIERQPRSDNTPEDPWGHVAKQLNNSSIKLKKNTLYTLIINLENKEYFDNYQLKNRSLIFNAGDFHATAPQIDIRNAIGSDKVSIILDEDQEITESFLMTYSNPYKNRGRVIINKLELFEGFQMSGNPKFVEDRLYSDFINDEKQLFVMTNEKEVKLSRMLMDSDDPNNKLIDPPYDDASRVITNSKNEIFMSYRTTINSIDYIIDNPFLPDIGYTQALGSLYLHYDTPAERSFAHKFFAEKLENVSFKIGHVNTVMEKDKPYIISFLADLEGMNGKGYLNIFLKRKDSELTPDFNIRNVTDSLFIEDYDHGPLKRYMYIITPDRDIEDVEVFATVRRCYSGSWDVGVWPIDGEMPPDFPPYLDHRPNTSSSILMNFNLTLKEFSIQKGYKYSVYKPSDKDELGVTKLEGEVNDINKKIDTIDNSYQRGMAMTSDGEVFVELLERIVSNMKPDEEYHVFLQPMGNVSVWVTDPGTTGFTVNSSVPSVKFYYRVEVLKKEEG